jgi:hypothetical protein
LRPGLAKRDVVFLLADGGMEQVVRGFLGRERFHRSLGCGVFGFDPDQDVVVAPTKDPGVYGTARELLRPYERSHQRAVVMLDADWDGSPGATAIRDRVARNLDGVWRECAVIVIEPELEAWIMQDSQHLVQVLRCPADFRKILADAGLWPEGSAKPPRPKEALDHLRRHHKVRAFNADFGKLAAVMSVRRCQDAAFIQLRDCLRAWFPERP